MGTFTATLEVRKLSGGEFAAVEALVDTGALYTMVSSDVLEELGVQPTRRRRFVTADGRPVEYPTGSAWLRLEGIEDAAPVIFGSPKAGALIGATTLQILGLIADSVNERLIPMEYIEARPF